MGAVNVEFMGKFGDNKFSKASMMHHSVMPVWLNTYMYVLSF